MKPHMLATAMLLARARLHSNCLPGQHSKRSNPHGLQRHSTYLRCRAYINGHDENLDLPHTLAGRLRKGRSARLSYTGRRWAGYQQSGRALVAGDAARHA